MESRCTLTRTSLWKCTSNMWRSHATSKSEISIGSDEFCQTAHVQVLVTSRMDYCNSLLIGMPKCDLHRLKKVQHSAAGLVSMPNRSEDITSVLEDLHWLQIPEQIKKHIKHCTGKHQTIYSSSLEHTIQHKV